MSGGQTIYIYINMSGGQNYLLIAMDIAKVAFFFSRMGKGTDHQTAKFHFRPSALYAQVFWLMYQSG